MVKVLLGSSAFPDFKLWLDLADGDAETVLRRTRRAGEAFAMGFEREATDLDAPVADAVLAVEGDYAPLFAHCQTPKQVADVLGCLEAADLIDDADALEVAAAYEAITSEAEDDFADVLARYVISTEWAGSDEASGAAYAREVTMLSEGFASAPYAEYVDWPRYWREQYRHGLVYGHYRSRFYVFREV